MIVTLFFHPFSSICMKGSTRTILIHLLSFFSVYSTFFPFEVPRFEFEVLFFQSWKSMFFSCVMCCVVVVSNQTVIMNQVGEVHDIIVVTVRNVSPDAFSYTKNPIENCTAEFLLCKKGLLKYLSVSNDKTGSPFPFLFCRSLTINEYNYCRKLYLIHTQYRLTRY